MPLQCDSKVPSSPRSFVAMFALVVAVAVTVIMPPAQAGGSIMLDEVMEQLHADGKLLSEIAAELKAQDLKAEDIGCEGSRFGNNWTHLGGERSIPYECLVGKRTLSIDGELHFYDKRGKELDPDDEKTFRRAFSYKATDLKWTWS